eukprot:4738355-Heterocapsa_arctica.AAC.1
MMIQVLFMKDSEPRRPASTWLSAAPWTTSASSTASSFSVGAQHAYVLRTAQSRRGEALGVGLPACFPAGKTGLPWGLAVEAGLAPWTCRRPGEQTPK